MSNPLLTKFDTPFSSIPFEKISLEHYKAAFEQGIKHGKVEIEAIKNNPETPDFKNTFEALENSGRLLNMVSSVFFNLNGAETSEEMQLLAQDISPMLSAYSSDILLDKVLFERLKQARENIDEHTLSEEQKTLLKETYDNFLNNGADLNDEDKKTLKELNAKLSKLSLTFGEHVLKDNNAFELIITDENDLKGLPDGIIEAAASVAKSKDKKGWMFTLDYPSYIPFMQHCDNRELRKKMYMAFRSKGFHDNDNNNEAVLKEIAHLRLQKANLLGFSSHAEKTLVKRMAINQENIFQLWDELLKYAKPAAKKELKEVQELCNSLDGPGKLKPWDFSYYSEKLKKQKFDIDDELLKPYFKLENVLDGAFKTAHKLFNISFSKRDDIQVYHKDVTVYEVLDEKGDHLALFYADFFPRPGKRGGAWMTSYSNIDKVRPHVSIVCNFTKPTESKPSLLTFQEVTTLFHEFGHALHGMLSEVEYDSLSGTSVYWDFVELPSQLMENWCYEPECLNMFARHYETNEPIPVEIIEKIKESAQFLSGYQTVRQVGLGKLDMAWHDLKKETNQSVEEFENEHTKDTELFEPIEGCNTSTSFSHIFQGGYSAGYYSYKWAEVLEADAFEHFKEHGIFNTEIAKKFRDCILSKGGSKHPMDLYKCFRGKEPSTKPLLKKAGLV